MSGVCIHTICHIFLPHGRVKTICKFTFCCPKIERRF